MKIVWVDMSDTDTFWKNKLLNLPSFQQNKWWPANAYFLRVLIGLELEADKS